MANVWSTAPSAPKIRVLSTHTLLPSSPTPRHAFFLPCFDILWKEIHYNRRVLFYEQHSTPSHSSDASASILKVEKLKQSLSLCLTHYFPWCGRLAKGADPPHRLFIDCNDAGVEFVEATLDMPLSLLAEDGFQMKPFFEQLCQMPDHRGDSLFSSPLLSIQVTTFSDGGFAVGVTQSHVVADGQSLWNFMISWAECCRGVSLSLPPLHDRQRLSLPDPSPERASLYNFVFPVKEEGDTMEATLNSTNGHSKSTENTDSSTYNSEPADPLVQCALHLSCSDVKKLKVEAGEGFTSYEVICAHFWQRTTASRQSPKHSATYFSVLANCRGQITPPLPPAYFGNVIPFAMVLSTAGRIGNETLSTTASRIHELAAYVQDTVDNFMHFLETHDNNLLSAIRNTPRGKGHNVASSPRFPVYQVDFGWGRPVAARPAKVVGDGELVLFGGHPGSSQGDVEICTALPASVMKRLLEDPLFLPKLPSRTKMCD